MNKLTPRMLRDLHETLPKGAECYLCAAVRKALAKYRNGYEPEVFMDQNQALSALAKKLGRGLKRFLRDDIRNALPADRLSMPRKMV